MYNPSIVEIMVTNIDGKPAVQVNAKVVHETEKAVLLDCDGDQKWFPKSTVRLDRANNLADIQTWIYDQQFPQG
jgi:hypothetical protein